MDDLSSEGDSSGVESYLSESGFKWEPIVTAKYVCHTSSIPLATVMDNPELKNNSLPYFVHGRTSDPSTHMCEGGYCMHSHKDGRVAIERVKENCPCLEVQVTTGKLQPICFLEILRELKSNLVKDQSLIKHEDVMFCKSNINIFDSSYPAWVRKRVNATGFDKIKTVEQIIGLMLNLYWFRTSKEKKLITVIRDFFKKESFFRCVNILKQVLFTINGLLIKKFLCFPDEIASYDQIAKQTQVMFIALLGDYTRPVFYNIFGEIVEPEDGVYKDLKDFFNFVKENFTKESWELKEKIYHYKFRTSAAKKFFSVELGKLAQNIRLEWFENETKYTESLSWYYRCSILHQTRILGYLPRAIAAAKQAYYRSVVSRLPQRVDKKELVKIYRLIKEELMLAKIPQMVLDKSTNREAEVKEAFIAIISNIELVVKHTASTKFTIARGGKLEDARILIEHARKNSWSVPIRDLDTGKITGFVKPPDLNEADADYTSFIFWTSYQLALNKLARAKTIAKENYYALVNSLNWEDEFFQAKILHIQEPGKLRNLTKSSGCLSWVLTPAGKICQAALSLLVEHEVGLTGSAHGWKHSRRISGMSEESRWMYYKGRIREQVQQIFADWTESTDFIEKEVGYTMLKSIMDHIGFPEHYKNIVLAIIMQPQPVTEVVEIFTDTNSEERISWKGYIRNGYMMGNPVTKTILHACHVVEIAGARDLLKNYDLFRSQISGAQNENRVFLDRKKLIESAIQTDLF